ncbi:MAG: aspartyl protease family protein, partial [Gammaproteobacteria bacterium]
MIPDSFIKKMNLFQVFRSIFLFGVTILGFLLSGFELNAQEWEPEDSYELIDQLYEFAEENNFTVRGTEKIGPMDSRLVRGDLESKIQQLLAGFNYMLIRSNEGQIVKLIILNKIVKRPNQIVLNSKKSGRNHIVSVSLKGISGDWLDLDLIVDTGSEFIVLPDSLMEKLGYSSENLPTRTLQTVNGITDAKTAQLEAIEIGNR